VKVFNKCKKCQKQFEAGSSGNAVAGDWFCKDCFVCATCNCSLDIESFVLDKELREKGLYACICKSCADAKAPAVAATPTTCLVCSEPIGDRDHIVVDGQAILRECVKCASCGSTADADKPALLASKLRSLKAKNYTCSSCTEAIEAELGTYGGKGKVGRDDISYCVRFRPRNSCWLDYTSMNHISTTSWHAEGKYKRTPKLEGGALVTFTVECCPLGGGPKEGTVFSIEMEADGSTLVCEGVHCAKTAADAYMADGAAGQDEFMSKKAAAAAPVQSQPDQKEVAPTQTATVATAIPVTPAKSLTLEDLRDPHICSTHGVDPAAKEAHLADDQFSTVFGMSRDEFVKLPKWKRDKQKKEVGLF